MRAGEEQYFTATQAMEYLHVSHSTFYKRYMPKLTPYRQGQIAKKVYSKSQLDELNKITPIEPEVAELAS